MIEPLLAQLQCLPTDCCRLLHGRGDFFPGLKHVAVDWFNPVVLVTLYSEGEADDVLLDGLVVVAERSADIGAIVVQCRYLAGAPKRVIYGVLPTEPVAVESGLRYHLNLRSNQNHGFFLDMKSGRDWVRAKAPRKRVLNLFAYTCSLSVAAIAGGAESVVNLDMASGALVTGRGNHRLNFDTEMCRRSSYLAHDLFKSWGKVKREGPYDLIIIDPPSNQAGSFVAEKDYQKIVRRLPDLTHAQSEVLACLNAPHLNEGFLRDLFVDFHCRERLPAAAGFEDKNPQAALKSMIFAQKSGL